MIIKVLLFLKYIVKVISIIYTKKQKIIIENIQNNGFVIYMII